MHSSFASLKSWRSCPVLIPAWEIRHQPWTKALGFSSLVWVEGLQKALDFEDEEVKQKTTVTFRATFPTSQEIIPVKWNALDLPVPICLGKCISKVGILPPILLSLWESRTCCCARSWDRWILGKAAAAQPHHPGGSETQEPKNPGVQEFTIIYINFTVGMARPCSWQSPAALLTGKAEWFQPPKAGKLTSWLKQTVIHISHYSPTHHRA